LNSEVDSRFARARYFVVTDVETGVNCVIDNAENRNANGVAGYRTARSIGDTGAKAVLTGDIGPNAFAALSSQDIAIYTGVKGTVARAIKRFLADGLRAATTPSVETPSSES
jgi:predicted Fe-Mo cluster-binding NifX family protein